MIQIQGVVTNFTERALQIECPEFQKPEWFPLSTITGLDLTNLHEGQTIEIQVSDWIAEAKGLTISKSTNSPEEEGVYILGNQIIKMKRSRTSGRLYANKLVEINGNRLNEQNKVVKFEYQYAPELTAQVGAENKMTKEQAIYFGLRYGKCLRCSRKLKDAKSVEQAIGPICMKFYSGGK